MTLSPGSSWWSGTTTALTYSVVGPSTKPSTLAGRYAFINFITSLLSEYSRPFTRPEGRVPRRGWISLWGLLRKEDRGSERGPYPEKDRGDGYTFEESVGSCFGRGPGRTRPWRVGGPGTEELKPRTPRSLPSVPLVSGVPTVKSPSQCLSRGDGVDRPGEGARRGPTNTILLEGGKGLAVGEDIRGTSSTTLSSLGTTT